MTKRSKKNDNIHDVPAAEVQKILCELSYLLEKFVITHPPPRLTKEFYENENTLQVARKLLHCLLWSRNENNEITVGRISETEAYIAPKDDASHASKGSKTRRNAVMFQSGGIAYIYICYGVHVMMNVVTNKVEIPHVVLLRGIFPVVGLELMCTRRKSLCKTADYLRGNPKQLCDIGKGPGCLGQCLGLRLSDNGTDLINGNRLWLTEAVDVEALIEFVLANKKNNLFQNSNLLKHFLESHWSFFTQSTVFQKIEKSPRIGIESASEYSRNLEYRFFVEGDLSVSKYKISAKKLKKSET